MRGTSKSLPSTSEMYQLTDSKSWFLKKRSSPSKECKSAERSERQMGIEGRDESELQADRLSSPSQSSMSYGISQTFSAIKYFGFSAEPSMSSDDKYDTIFDAFMDVSAHKRLQKNRTTAITAKSLSPSEKKGSIAMFKALACIANKNYKRFLLIVKNNPSILLLKTNKTNLRLRGCNGGTLLHVLVSQRSKIKKKHQKTSNFKQKEDSELAIDIQVYPSVPENVLKFVIKICPVALGIKDDNGQLPIHCACISQALCLEDILKLRRNATDADLPLRFNVMETNVVNLLLKHNFNCASVPDNKGNLPLHYAASMVSDCIDENNSVSFRWTKNISLSAEETMKRLLIAYPHGIAMKNAKGLLPIHRSVSLGADMNRNCVQLLLHSHQTLREAPTQRNEEGDPPLYIALKCGASYESIECFCRSEFCLRLFMQRDGDNNNALHVALLSTYPDTAVIRTILKAAPFTASSPASDGIMPLRMATQLRLKSDIIRTLLTRDMPIEIGIDTNKSVTPLKYKFKVKEKGNRDKLSNLKMHIIRRSHHHSWWFILVQCNDFYMDIVYNLLSQEATHFQIVSLARQIGPDGKSILINCVSNSCRVMFHSLLRFYDRYEILLSTNELHAYCEDIVDGVQTFLALDHGGLPPITATAYSDAKLNIPYFTNAVKIEHDQELDSNVEICLLPEEKKKVLLRTYLYDEAFYAELKVREKYAFSSTQFEEIYNYHNHESFTHLNLSKSDKMSCIVFERPCHSLVDVFASVTGSSRSKQWITKCWVVLKQIATALKALHHQNLVHGHLVPSNCCKFGNIWKLSQLGTIVETGTPMRGTFRSCIPPESIFVVESKKSIISTQTFDKHSYFDASPSRVQFTAWALDEGKERKSTRTKTRTNKIENNTNILFHRAIFGHKTQNAPHSKLKNEGRTDKESVELTFHPERVVSTAAWDMWGFGLIMVQLLTGRCMYLSNFEKAQDAVIKKLHHYDDGVLDCICSQMDTSVGKDAADLVRMLLQKDPAKRPASMGDVLKYPYFESLTIYV